MNFILKGIAKLVYGGIPAGSLAAAQDNFERAIAIAPGRIIHRHQLAQTLIALGKKSDAIARLQQCLALKPVDKDDAEAQAEAGRQLRTLGVAVTPAR